MMIDNATRGSLDEGVSLVVSCDLKPSRSENKKKQRYRTIRKKFPRVYLYSKNGGEYFVVDCRSKQWGLNYRKNFNNQPEAIAYAQEVDEQIKTNGNAVSDNLIYQNKDIEKWDAALKVHGKSIVDAVDHYLTFLQEQLKKSVVPAISKLAETWYQAKTTSTLEPLRSRTKNEYKSHRNFIIRTLGELKPEEVTKSEVEEVLKDIEAGQHTRKKHCQYLKNFFNWCIAEGYCRTNPTKTVKIKIPETEITIFTPEQVEKLMRLCEEHYPSLLGYYALCVFGGLRPSEAERVTYTHLHFEGKEVWVQKEGKTGSRRFVLRNTDTLWVWLNHIKATRPDEPLNPTSNHYGLQKNVRSKLKESGIFWAQDVLRHTFGTNYYNLTKDLNLVSHDMGNTPEVCRNHYVREISQADRLKFWAIQPKA
jgi:integrase